MRPVTRPSWPTHKTKRHRLTNARPEPEELAPSSDDMARSLVKRGLASKWILDSMPAPRRRSAP